MIRKMGDFFANKMKKTFEKWAWPNGDRFIFSPFDGPVIEGEEENVIVGETLWNGRNTKWICFWTGGLVGGEQ